MASESTDYDRVWARRSIQDGRGRGKGSSKETDDQVSQGALPTALVMARSKCQISLPRSSWGQDLGGCASQEHLGG